MIKLISFFQFNQLKILRQTGYLIFFKLIQQYFFTVQYFINIFGTLILRTVCIEV